MDVSIYQSPEWRFAAERVDVGEENASAPAVTIVSCHREFAAGLLEQISSLGVRIHAHALEGAVDIQNFCGLLPDVAIVDYDATTTDGVPLYQAFGKFIPDCKVILLCTREQAAEAARAVRYRQAFDYLLTDCNLDPHRIRLLIQRTQVDASPNSSEVRGMAKLQNPKVLMLLGEIKEILKADCTSPVVKAIREFKSASAQNEDGDARSKAKLASEYQTCLIDFLCGKLRRLEREIRMVEEPDAVEAGETDTVLLVEDDFVSAELAKGLLERNGFDVIVARTDDEAVRHLARQRPSLVLMDIHLGMSDGLRVVKMMRSRADLRSVPVIIVTADHQRETLYDAVETNIQGYLLKPYQPKEFIDKVKHAIYSAPPAGID